MPQAHRLAGTLAFIVSLPVAYQCLWLFGSNKIVNPWWAVHSIAGCLVFGAFVTKVLCVRNRKLPRWVCPWRWGGVRLTHRRLGNDLGVVVVQVRVPVVLMKRLTNIVQIIAACATAFFVVCLFTSSFPPWSSDDDDGAGAAPNTTVVAAGTTAAAVGTTAAGGAVTTAGGAGTTAAAATTAAANDIDGQALYDDQCASCHGKTGGGGFGPSLEGIGDRMSEEEEADIIANGQGSMPAFGGDLSGEEIAARSSRTPARSAERLRLHDAAGYASITAAGYASMTLPATPP